MVPQRYVQMVQRVRMVQLSQELARGAAMDKRLRKAGIKESHFNTGEGTAGEGFDHAETLARITQPVLFLHANWSMHQGRLFGALDDADVARAQSLVKGPWKYLHMGCEHVMALDAPEREAKEISAWAHDSVH
jgi:hypothetical protein